MTMQHDKEIDECVRVQGDIQSHLEWVECKIESWPEWKRDIVEFSCRSDDPLSSSQQDEAVSA